MAKKETLKEQQARLDKEKWCRSVATSCDQSGLMWYCKDCTKRIGDYHCHATQSKSCNGIIQRQSNWKEKRYSQNQYIYADKKWSKENINY